MFNPSNFLGSLQSVAGASFYWLAGRLVLHAQVVHDERLDVGVLVNPVFRTV